MQGFVGTPLSKRFERSGLQGGAPRCMFVFMSPITATYGAFRKVSIFRRPQSRPPVLYSLLSRPQKGTPNIGKPPSLNPKP